MLNDFLGKPIELGHILIYPVRRKSTMYLRKAQVISLDPLTVRSGKYSRHPKPDRCVVVTGKTVHIYV